MGTLKKSKLLSVKTDFGINRSRAFLVLFEASPNMLDCCMAVKTKAGALKKARLLASDDHPVVKL
jgi:hypothetical protein